MCLCNSLLSTQDKPYKNLGWFTLELVVIYIIVLCMVLLDNSVSTFSDIVVAAVEQVD